MKDATRRRNSNIAKVVASLLLAGAILYWMYRDVDFAAMRAVMVGGMNWWWMLLSLPFGVLAQMCRGWRWRQTLAPLQAFPRTSVAVSAIFVSYGVSLVVPRIGEFVRCGILLNKDRVSFVRALGTVVTERVIDSLLLLVITLAVLFSELTIFHRFFTATGVDLLAMLRGFTWQGYVVTLICLVVAGISLHILFRRMTFYKKVLDTLHSLWEGIISLRHVSNIPLFITLTIGIWLCYFLHYYLTFFCFDATRDIGLLCALVTFAIGSIAVIVPTPNGAGPWHFAVKTMLILYGVATNDALFFVFIVHTIQTLLVVLLAIIGWIHISLIPARR